MMEVNGGFFWLQEGACIRQTDTVDSVTNCVFMLRPRWYQIIRWWTVWRSLLNLPHLSADHVSTHAALNMVGKR